MLTTIEDALEQIGTKKVDKVNECLETGKKLILKRQKLVRITDREEDGWEVVNCYVSDDLASDSNDENVWQRQGGRHLHVRRSLSRNAKKRGKLE